MSSSLLAVVMCRHGAVMCDVDMGGLSRRDIEDAHMRPVHCVTGVGLSACCSFSNQPGIPSPSLKIQGYLNTPLSRGFFCLPSPRTAEKAPAPQRSDSVLRQVLVEQKQNAM